MLRANRNVDENLPISKLTDCHSIAQLDGRHSRLDNTERYRLDNHMNLEIVSVIIQGVMTVGVVAAVVQLGMQKRQSRADFEGELQNRYLDVVEQLPVESFLGKELDPELLKSHLRDFYTFFHLTNYQISLRAKGRITKTTWEHWRGGMKFNMQLPAFIQAWREVSRALEDGPDALGHLQGLRSMVEKRFHGDPRC